MNKFCGGVLLMDQFMWNMQDRAIQGNPENSDTTFGTNPDDSDTECL